MYWKEIGSLFISAANILFSGIELYSELAKVYRARDETINQIIRMTLNFGEIAAVLAHIMPLMYPLIYSCFGFPSPDIWFTPLSIHEGYKPRNLNICWK